MKARGKVVIAGAVVVALAAGGWVLRSQGPTAGDDGAGPEGDTQVLRGSPPNRLLSQQAEGPGEAQPATEVPVEAPRPSQDGASPAQASAAPSASEQAHRAALAQPRNPERWLDYARALDAEGKHDLALAALRRALHLGVDFEGRREVMRLVREYEEYLARTGGAKAPADHRAPPEKPRKPDHSRSR